VTLDQWTDVALVFLLAQVFFVCIGFGIALFYSVRAVAQADRGIRAWLPRVRTRADALAAQSEAFGENVKAPIVVASSRMAQIDRTLKAAAASARPKRT